MSQKLKSYGQKYSDLTAILGLRAYFHYGCALRCVASDSQR